jgi:hypothetical protein
MLVFCDDTDLTGTPRPVHQLQWCGAAIVQIEVIEVDNWNPTFSGRNCDLTHPAANAASLALEREVSARFASFDLLQKAGRAIRNVGA